MITEINNIIINRRIHSVNPYFLILYSNLAEPLRFFTVNGVFLMKYSILFVVDEGRVYQALDRLFADEPFELFFVADGSKALELLNHGEHPAVIVTDQQIPGMTGVEFLRLAKELSPESVRLMLAAYADINSVIEAINSSGIYRYILKPWNDLDLKQAVDDAVVYYSMAHENRKLTDEIAKKNFLLKEINDQLENKIAERTKALKDAYDENIVLTRELQARVIELEGRDRILRQLLTIHELEETLDIALEVICQVAALDWAAVYLPEENRSDFKRVAFYGRDSEDKSDLAVIGERVRQVFDSSEYLLGNENNFSMLLMPVIRNRKCLGVVIAARCWEYLENAINRDDMVKIEQFMAHIAIAVTDAQVDIDLSAWDESLDDILQNYFK